MVISASSSSILRSFIVASRPTCVLGWRAISSSKRALASLRAFLASFSSRILLISASLALLSATACPDNNRPSNSNGLDMVLSPLSFRLKCVKINRINNNLVLRLRIVCSRNDKLINFAVPGASIYRTSLPQLVCVFRHHRRTRNGGGSPCLPPHFLQHWRCQRQLHCLCTTLLLAGMFVVTTTLEVV